MTYTLVIPEEQLSDLVFIRAVCKESIRSLCLTAIEERNKEVIAGIKLVHGEEYINKLKEKLDKAFKGSQ